MSDLSTVRWFKKVDGWLLAGASFLGIPTPAAAHEDEQSVPGNVNYFLFDNIFGNNQNHSERKCFKHKDLQNYTFFRITLLP